MVKLYHKVLKRTVEVSEGRARVLEKSGWSEDVPKKHQHETPANPPTAIRTAETPEEEE